MVPAPGTLPVEPAALLRVLAGLALSTWVGDRVLAACAAPSAAGPAGCAGSRSERCALAYGCGLVVVTALLLLLGLARVPLTLSVAGGALAVLGLGLQGLVRVRSRVRPAPGAPGAASSAGQSPARGPPPFRMPCAALLALLIALVLGVTGLSIVNAADFVDAHAVWLLRGRAWFLDGGFDGAYFAQWIDVHDRRGYPPLLSLSATWAHLCAGRVDEGAAKLVMGGFYAALLVVFCGGLRAWLGRGAALAATLLLASVPAAIASALWGTADLPLAYFTCAAGVALARGSGRISAPGALSVAGLGCAGAALCKNEGLVLAIALPVALVLCRHSDAARSAEPDGTAEVGAAGAAPAAPRRRPRDLALLLLPTLLLLGLWWLVLRQHGIPLRPTPPATAAALPLAERLLLVGAAGARCVLDPAWLFTWPLLLAALVVLRLRRQVLRGSLLARLGVIGLCVVGFTVAAQAGVLASFGGNLPLLLQTTMLRLPLHTLPLALLLALAVLAGDRRAPDLPPPAQRG